LTHRSTHGRLLSFLYDFVRFSPVVVGLLKQHMVVVLSVVVVVKGHDASHEGVLSIFGLLIDTNVDLFNRDNDSLLDEVSGGDG
jgi:hypothetical protein